MGSSSYIDDGERQRGARRPMRRRPFSRSEVMNPSFQKRNATVLVEAGQGAKANQNSATNSKPNGLTTPRI